MTNTSAAIESIARELDEVSARSGSAGGNIDEVKKLAGVRHLLLEQGSKLDRWFFCTMLAKTQDEHADPEKESPFKLFPQHEYLRLAVREWERVSQLPTNRILLILKSRQVMVSWVAIAMVLWSCLFERGRTIGWQSKKSEDANKMLRDRLYAMWERLPPLIRARHPCEYREGELRFADRKNIVMALPEGPDKPRQFTWSLFISDEMAFQEGSRATYVAVQPAIVGGGMYVAISTAAPSFFYDMVEDRAE